MFKRFNPSEITPRRLSDAIYRRIADLSHRAAWAFDADALKNKELLLEQKDRYRGERCFLMANGPSLTSTNLNALSSEYTFGMNRIYLLFDRISFKPTFYTAVNTLVLEQFAHEINELDMIRFLNWDLRRYFAKPKPNMLYIKPALTLNDFFTTDLAHPIDIGGTVTFAALQIIYYLGFQEVVIVGLDHRFKEGGIPNRVEQRDSEVDRNHFDPVYFPKGVKWQLPDLRRSEVVYRLAREAYESNGRRILDATPDGGCEVFEKVDFNSVL